MKVEDQLAAPFAKGVERVLKKGNAQLTYIPVSEVITRLNEVFGVGNWGYTIQSCQRDAIDTDFVIAHVRMTITNSFAVIGEIDGIGGQKINRDRNGQVLNLGDDMKGAVSDALKKAAQAVGVGLYLARSEEPVRKDEPAAGKASNDLLITEAQVKTLRNLFAQIYGKEIPAETVASELLKREVADIATITRAEGSNMIGEAIKARKEVQ
jgi:hypothetical protein